MADKSISNSSSLTFFIIERLTLVRLDNGDDGLLENGIVARVLRLAPSGNNTVRARCWRNVVLGQADRLDIVVELDLLAQTNETNIIDDRIGSRFEILVTCDFGNEVGFLVGFGVFFRVDFGVGTECDGELLRTDDAPAAETVSSCQNMIRIDD